MMKSYTNGKNASPRVPESPRPHVPESPCPLSLRPRPTYRHSRWVRHFDIFMLLAKRAHVRHYGQPELIYRPTHFI